MKAESSMIVIFGATGDLTRRKLLPSLYRLFLRDKLAESTAIVCIGRDELSHRDYLAHLDLDSFIRNSDDTSPQAFLDKVYYRCFDLEKGTAERLLEMLGEVQELSGCSDNKLIYLALPTSIFGRAAELVQAAAGKSGWLRVVFEKPFGEDLRSAAELNDRIGTYLDEEQIYRVDHYLGKELVQNILFLRFTNEIFSCAWNRDAIDHIQVTVSESLGVEERAGYYDQTGAIRDMVQNHLLQLLSLVAMEPPVSGDGNAVRDEAARVLGSVRPPRSEDVVIGQYGGGTGDNRELAAYRQEDNISPDSGTETYAAVRVFVDNPRWQGVPFYLRTGKRLEKRFAEIRVVFKKPLISGLAPDSRANTIVIRIQPDEGIALAFNVRKPDTTGESESVLMDFCHHCHFGPNTPEAYEVILWNVIKGDPLLFIRWDWLQASWKYIDQLRDVMGRPLPYTAGSRGPAQADHLLERDGRKWR